MLEPTLAFIGLILSAFFSGSEIAFIQANPIQVEVWKKQGRRIAGSTHLLLSEPERYLTTVLVGTNIANVLTSSFATVILIRSGISPLLAAFTITVIILIFGEIVPKVIFRDHATSLSVMITPLIRLFEIILTPFVKLVQSYSRLITSQQNLTSSHLSRQELKWLFRSVETSEEYEEEEKEVITNIFEFGTNPVYLAMTPKSDIIAIREDTSIQEVMEIFIDTGYSKLPVYQDKLDEIVGIVFLHDLFTSPSSLKSVMKPPIFILSSITAREVLEELQRQNSSIAIVQDDKGKTSGLVTVEDLMEEIFGEFEDVFDDTGRKINQLTDGNLIVDSLVEIDDLNRRFNYQIAEGNYETIGGFILSKLGRFPRTGEILDFGTFRVRVLKRSPNRLERLLLSQKKAS